MKVTYQGNIELGGGIWVSPDGQPIYRKTRNFRAALNDRQVIVINDPFKNPQIIYADDLTKCPFVDGLELEIDIPARPHIDMDSYQYDHVVLPKLVLRTLLWHAFNNGCKDLDIDYCLALLSNEPTTGFVTQDLITAEKTIDDLRNTGTWVDVHSGYMCLDGDFSVDELLALAFVATNKG